MPTSPTHLNRWSLPWRAHESKWERGFYLLIALLVIGLVAATYMAFWVPADGGVDQNGYMVGGKMYAQSFTTKFTPSNPVTGKPDPYQFVGRMWVGTDLGLPTERYYPKYPVGMSILVAVALKVAGSSAAYLISPLGMALGLLASFLLMRHIVGSFLGLIGMFLVATSPVLLGLSLVPMSHGADFLFVTWGMYWLWLWMDQGRFRWAILAGFMLGFSVTIRYTDGLLVLPLLWGALCCTQWRSLRSRFETLAMLVAWAVPVVYLAVFNLYSLASLTGYDPTNESTGFSWQYFFDNWENMFRQLNNGALFLLFPLGAAGMCFLVWWHKRLSVWLWLWILPTLLLYTAYYWAPAARNNTSYLRFFLSLLPGLALAAMVVVAHVRLNLPRIAKAPEADQAKKNEQDEQADAAGVSVPAVAVPRPDAWQRWGLALTIGALAILSAGMNLRDATVYLHGKYVTNIGLARVEAKLKPVLPPDAIVYSSDGRLFQYLQFVTDYQLYTTEFYNQRSIRRLKNIDVDQPQGLQPQRRLAMYDLLKGKNQKELTAANNQDIKLLLDAGKKIYVITRTRPWVPIKRRPKHGWSTIMPNMWPSPGDRTFDVKVLASWCNPRTIRKRRHIPRDPRNDDLNILLDPRRDGWCVVQLTLKPPPPPKAAPKPKAAHKSAPKPKAAAKATTKTPAKTTTKTPAKPKAGR